VFHSPCSLQRFHRSSSFIPHRVFNHAFPFPVPVPGPVLLPLPLLRCLVLPLPVLRPLPFPLPILRSHPFPGSFLAALRVLLTLAVIIVIAIARTARSTAQRSRIRLVLIIIILVNYLIPFQWSNGHEVASLVLPAAWRLNLGPEIIATVLRVTLGGAFNLP